MKERDLIDDRPVGAALGRDLAPGEAVEGAIDHFISIRHEKRVKEEGDRVEAEAWKESERRMQEKRRQQNRVEWHLYHSDPAERHRRTLEQLIAHHETQAKKLMNGSANGATKGA
jgi:hypothetical protein